MAFHTIKLKKYSDIIEEYKAAAATIYPGCLIELNSSGTVQVHATAGGNVLPMFALEDELQGNDIDTAYAEGDQVQCWIATRGEIVYAILADGQDVHIGDPLESNGAGYLQKHVPDWESSDPGVETAKNLTNQIVGYALENVDSSADSSGVDFLVTNKRIKVRIL
jgi:hypothetical protein